MDAKKFHQEITKKKNQRKILKLLELGGKTYTELALQLKSEFSETTLSKHLNSLLETREIKFGIKNNEQVYELGDKGIINPADISHVSNFIKNIKKRGGHAIYDYSQLQGEISSALLPWGIISYLIRDKDLKKIVLLTKEDVREIEEIIFQKIAHNMKNKKYSMTTSNLQLGFNIDFAKLLESFKTESLKYYENMSKKEVNLLIKMSDQPESVTDKEVKQFQNLREKTFEKIKKSK